MVISMGSVAPAREWTSANGANKLVGDFVKLEKSMITLKRPNGRLVKFDISKLSKEDQKFARKKAGIKEPVQKGNFSVFDQFRFGQSRNSVEAELKRNRDIQGGIHDIFLARTGINGLYFVSIEGERFDLFFEWDEDERLKEIVLQSSPFNPGDYDTSLKKTWQRLRNNFCTRYGEPQNTTGFPKNSMLVEGGAMSSDIWELGTKKHFYLGTGRKDGKASCVLRCGAEPYVVSKPKLKLR